MNFNEYLLNEMASNKSDYMILVHGAEEQIFYHSAYIILYDDPENVPHWSKEMFGFVGRLKKTTMYGGNKQKVTKNMLLVGPHGDNFPRTGKRGKTPSRISGTTKINPGISATTSRTKRIGKFFSTR
jgi:hypothetical protein